MRASVNTMSMLIISLVFTQVSAEWVEISQQHYRKPIRIHSMHNPFTSTDKIKVEDTTKAWMYKVSTNIDYNWTRASENQPYERPQLPSADDRDVAIDKQRDLDEDEFKLKGTHALTKLTENSDIGTQKAIIETVPNKGNVKRVQLKNNPVISPVINNKTEKDSIRNRYEEYSLDNAEVAIEDKSKILTKINNRRIYLNQQSSELTSTFPMIEDSTYRGYPKQQYKNHTLIENILVPTPNFITTTENLAHIDELEEFEKISQKKYVFTTETSDVFNEVVSKQNYNSLQQTNENNDTKKDKNRINVFQKQANNKITSAESNTNPTVLNNDQRENKNNETPMKESTIENKNQDLKKYVDDLRKEEETPKESIPKNKVNSMDNLLKLLKTVTDTISQNSRRSFGGKIRYLQELKDSILANIAERIEATWPDDVTAGPRRSSRSTKASPRGHHLHVPSSESALMSISFLTFAVFLIKLVLQLIQTYKNKAMMVAPVMVASASRAARTHQPRQ